MSPVTSVLFVLQLEFSVRVKEKSTSVCPKTYISDLSPTQCYTWLDSDDHSRTEFNRSLYVVSVVNIHAEVMAHVVWTELTSHLQFNIIKNCTAAAT